MVLRETLGEQGVHGQDATTAGARRYPGSTIRPTDPGRMALRQHASCGLAARTLAGDAAGLDVEWRDVHPQRV